MVKKTIHNPHAGEILKEEFLDALNMSPNALAQTINLPTNHIHDIIHRKSSITTDTDLLLCNFFKLSEGYFLRLQKAYKFLEAKRSNNN